MKTVYFTIKYYEANPEDLKVDYFKCKCGYYGEVLSVIGYLVIYYSKQFNLHTVDWKCKKPRVAKVITDLSNSEYNSMKRIILL